MGVKTWKDLVWATGLMENKDGKLQWLEVVIARTNEIPDDESHLRFVSNLKGFREGLYIKFKEKKESRKQKKNSLQEQKNKLIENIEDNMKDNNWNYSRKKRVVGIKNKETTKIPELSSQVRTLKTIVKATRN